MSMRYQGGFLTVSYNGLKVPNPPTIGTATGGVGSVSVAFTAPSNVGGGAITSYTAISTPGGFTGTATSSPITVSGLSSGTSYTFQVFATNAYGSSVLSSASNSASLLAIGDVYGGGYFAGQISTAGTGVANYNLVVAPVSSGQNNSVFFQTGPGFNSGALSDIDGPANSASMNDASHPAAQFCEAVSVGGYSDWYLPAVNELEVCYYNLKPSTVSNNTSSGINPNSVPARASNYTSGTPTRTSATVFQSGQAQAFAEVRYWTSTQDSSIGNRARFQTFYTGQQGNYYKVSYFRARAVRRVVA